jgi:branched-chain amino acid transport system ATP-binding protein
MPPVLQLDDVHAGYGRVEILRGVSLSVPERSVVALLGSNGVGKTTALRAISGTLPVTSGAVRLDGRRVERLRPDERARQGLVLIPEGRGIFPGLSVEENLRLAHASAAGGPAWPEWFDEIAGVFPRLAERRSQVAGSLSGGEQQMLAISRALVGDPRLVMFDELSMGLAPRVVQQLFEHVAALRDAGRTILLVEQYLTHALRLADVCYVMGKGRITWAGEPSELRAGAVDYLAV